MFVSLDRLKPVNVPQPTHQPSQDASTSVAQLKEDKNLGKEQSEYEYLKEKSVL